MSQNSCTSQNHASWNVAYGIHTSWVYDLRGAFSHIRYDASDIYSTGV